MDNWLCNHWRGIVGTAAVFVAVYSINLATRAVDESRTTNDRLTTVENLRAHGACESSTSLRALLEQWIPVLESSPNTRPETRALEQAIKDFTATNPNCENVPR